jgi:sugar lactone lactonase YvrE
VPRLVGARATRENRPVIDAQTFATGFDHPEGIAFDAGGALWAGGELGQVYRLDPGGAEPVEVARHGGETRGLAFDADGTLIVCNHLLAAVFRVTPDGRSEALDTVAAGRALRVPNAAAFGPDGSLYVSDSWRFPEPDGYVYRWPPGGGAPEIFHSGPFAYPNGLAVDGDGDWLYVVETAADAISRVPLGRPEGPVERVATGLPRMPDGLALDADGAIWVAGYAADAVARVDAGEVEVVAHDDRAIVLNRPANLAFRGERLFVANLGARSVAVLDAGVRGQPLWPAAAAARA